MPNAYRETTVFWASTPGRIYRVESATNLNGAAWEAVPGDVTAGANAAAKLHVTPEPSEPNRYYRVRLAD